MKMVFKVKMLFVFYRSLHYTQKSVKMLQLIEYQEEFGSSSIFKHPRKSLTNVSQGNRFCTIACHMKPIKIQEKLLFNYKVFV
jgi:hypothetical protein